ncbi:hypothetical protein HY450_02305 [Candidatus Pacearchaeota archaeon]|nr:hypothetical protein [Candidatus Pacearchaeota archaeon]
MVVKKGQISIEYLIIISFVVFLVLSIIGVALYYSAGIKDAVRFNQLERLSSKIITSAESVFYSGEPSKVVINGYLPEGVREINISNREIAFTLTTNTGVSKISYSSSVEIEGEISISPGVKRISVTAEQSKVVISEI